MLTCGKNFNHIVDTDYNKKSQELVQSGIYSIVRHPSYTGWFIWSVSSQMILGNPVCTVFFMLASWAFFKERIPDEEEALIYKFGDFYREYQKKVWIGVPYVKMGVVAPLPKKSNNKT